VVILVLCFVGWGVSCLLSLLAGVESVLV